MQLEMNSFLSVIFANFSTALRHCGEVGGKSAMLYFNFSVVC